MYFGSLMARWRCGVNVDYKQCVRSSACPADSDSHQSHAPLRMTPDYKFRKLAGVGMTHSRKLAGDLRGCFIPSPLMGC